MVRRFAAIRVWEDGGQTLEEFFETQEACLAWIFRQIQPRNDEFVWHVGEF